MLRSSFWILLAFLCTQVHGARIVSLSPVATEFLFALGLGGEVVGVTTYCDKPAQAKAIPKIGGFADPQLEAILRLKPDLAVATPYGGTVQVVESLRKRGVKVAAQAVESLDEMRRFLALVGSATQRETQAASLQLKLDHGYAAFKNRLGHHPRALILISASPLIGAGPATFCGQILTHIGARNVLSEKASWPMLSLEALIKDPPDVIVINGGESTSDAARLALKPLLAKHPKIKLFVPKSGILQRPGPYILEDVRDLVEGLS